MVNLPKGYRLAKFNYKTVVFDEEFGGTQSAKAKELTRKLPKNIRERGIYS